LGPASDDRGGAAEWEREPGEMTFGSGSTGRPQHPAEEGERVSSANDKGKTPVKSPVGGQGGLGGGVFSVVGRVALGLELFHWSRKRLKFRGGLKEKNDVKKNRGKGETHDHSGAHKYQVTAKEKSDRKGSLNPVGARHRFRGVRSTKRRRGECYRCGGSGQSVLASASRKRS